MDVNRRVVLKGMAALFAVVGLPTWASVELLAHDRPAPLAQHLFFPTNPSPNPSVATEAVHLLNRIAYGPTAAELGRVQKLGINAYLEEQLQPAHGGGSHAHQPRFLRQARGQRHVCRCGRPRIRTAGGHDPADRLHAA